MVPVVMGCTHMHSGGKDMRLPGWGMGHLDGMDEEDLSDNMAFEQIPQQSEGGSYMNVGGKRTLGRRAARAKP